LRDVEISYAKYLAPQYDKPLPEMSDDDQTARFVAKETLAAWQKLPEAGETFIGVNTAWLEGYLELLEKELGICGR
jgi:hypothetical protein